MSNEVTNPQDAAQGASEIANIFDFSSNQIDTSEQDSGPKFPTWNPQVDKGKEYIFTMRLIPYLTNPAQSIVYKKFYWLVDDKGGFGFDSPVSVRGFCPVSRAYWDLVEENSKDARKNELSKQLRIQKVYGTTIQIKNDPKDANNNGKLFMYRLPVEINKFIDKQTHVDEEAIKAGKKEKELANPLAAYDIMVTVTKTDTGRDYAMELVENKTSIMVNGKQDITMDDQEGKAALVEMLKGVEWDIHEEYAYKEANEYTRKRVKHLLCTKFEQSNDFWEDIPLVNVHSGTASGNTTTLDQMAAPGAQAEPIVQEQQPSMTASPLESASPAATASPSVEQSPAANQDDAPAQTTSLPEQSTASNDTTKVESAQQATVNVNVDDIVNEIKSDNAK